MLSWIPFHRVLFRFQSHLWHLANQLCDLTLFLDRYSFTNFVYEGCIRWPRPPEQPVNQPGPSSSPPQTLSYQTTFKSIPFCVSYHDSILLFIFPSPSRMNVNQWFTESSFRISCVSLISGFLLKSFASESKYFYFVVLFCRNCEYRFVVQQFIVEN